jgi:hypothetical protein
MTIAPEKPFTMKKLLTLSFFLVFLTQWANAQLGVGLRGGLNFSSTSQELVNGMSRGIGSAPIYGLSLWYDMDLHFSAGMEFNYLTLSETLKYNASFSQDKLTDAATTPLINYLQIPIMGRVTFGEKKYKAFLTFGPYIGVGLSGKWTNGPEPIDNGNYITLTQDYDPAKFKQGDFKRLDLGGIIGFGGQYQVEKSGYIFIEGRIQLGFLDFYNKRTEAQTKGFTQSQSTYLIPSASWRNANISLGYCHTFKLPKKKSSNAVKKAGKQKR